MTADNDGSLGEAAYHTIREAIISCRLAPGERVTERGLATGLGLSISPVRTAMTRLDHEGLIQTIPRKGYQVTPMTVRSVNEIFEYWALFGGMMAGAGLAKAGDRQIAELAEGTRRLATVEAEPDNSRETALRVVDEVIAPLDLLASTVDNQYMLAEYRRLRGELRRVWVMVIQSRLLDPDRRPDDFDDYISAIENRDVDRFVAVLRKYIEQAHLRVSSSLTRFPSVLDTEIVPIGEKGPNRDGRRGMRTPPTLRQRRPPSDEASVDATL